jgi:hypothetical protein
VTVGAGGVAGEGVTVGAGGVVGVGAEAGRDPPKPSRSLLKGKIFAQRSIWGLLRHCWRETETERSGAISPRFSAVTNKFTRSEPLF